MLQHYIFQVYTVLYMASCNRKTAYFNVTRWSLVQCHCITSAFPSLSALFAAATSDVYFLTFSALCKQLLLRENAQFSVCLHALNTSQAQLPLSTIQFSQTTLVLELLVTVEIIFTSYWGEKKINTNKTQQFILNHSILSKYYNGEHSMYEIMWEGESLPIIFHSCEEKILLSFSAVVIHSKEHYS